MLNSFSTLMLSWFSGASTADLVNPAFLLNSSDMSPRWKKCPIVQDLVYIIRQWRQVSRQYNKATGTANNPTCWEAREQMPTRI